MRVPIPVAIVLCLVAMVATWWIGTRNKDFLTAPEIIPQIAVQDPPDRQAETSPTTGKNPSNSLLESAPDDEPVSLDTFVDQAAMGPTHLAELATNMQEAKWPHLAMLAWERIIDSTSPSNDELIAAQSGIRSLQSSPAATQRVIYPEEPYTITLNAGTATRLSAEVEELLKSAADLIQKASGRILKVQVRVTAGQNPAEATKLTPVALWITGPEESSRSSELLSFTTGPGKDIRQLLTVALGKLLREMVPKPLSRPPDAPEGADFATELERCFTRYTWESLGRRLNTPVEESVPAEPIQSQ